MSIEGWHRDSVLARTVFCTVLAAIWAAVLFVNWLGWSDYRALSDGVVTTATVTRIDEGRHVDTTHVRFVTDDGRVVTASTSDFARTALPRDEVIVRYAVSDPSVVQDEGKEPVEALLTMAFFLPLPVAATWWYFHLPPWRRRRTV